MDIWQNILTGVDASFSAQNLLFCFIGCLCGTLIGVLPGIGPLTTIAILLPVTYTLDPLTSLITIAGIYYGAQYGGSTTSILLKIPGETTSIVTVLDGYQMTLKGRAGAALAVAALGSLFGGIVGTLAIAGFGPILGTFASSFRSPEFFTLMVLGLIMAVLLANGSPLKSFGMVILGLLLAFVGRDKISGVLRYDLGIPELYEGVNFLLVAMGLFGLTEVLLNLENSPDKARKAMGAIGKLWPTKAEFKLAWPAAVRGAGLGTIIGVLPGGAAAIAPFASYTYERRRAKDPSRFGKGAVEGVAGPETANNAAAQTSFIPLLTLGIPSNATMAVIAGALMIQGIAPGPQVMTKQPELFWGLVVSMLIGNIILVIINLPLIGIWVRLLSVPYRLLFPMIVLFCCLGIYSASNSPFEIMLLFVMTCLGYVFNKAGCESAPFVLGFVLGPLMEENFRRTMAITRGDLLVFVERPICLIVIIISIVIVAAAIISPMRRKSLAEVSDEAA